MYTHFSCNTAWSLQQFYTIEVILSLFFIVRAPVGNQGRNMPAALSLLHFLTVDGFIVQRKQQHHHGPQCPPLSREGRPVRLRPPLPFYYPCCSRAGTMSRGTTGPARAPMIPPSLCRCARSKGRQWRACAPVSPSARRRVDRTQRAPARCYGSS